MIVTGWWIELLIIRSYARNAGIMGLAYVYAEIGAIPFLSCFRKGDREVPKGGLPLITHWVLPLHRLLALLEQVLMSTKEAS